ncbi:Ig-like domain-containing protein [Paenibacillus sp. FSL K6-0276]|uniref:Ig-like domain-containing protein n=1 Tax=Paenibacillus sp. FSL K6-0276 TaxID=2921450 RepID=UPI0030EF145C
MTVYRKMTKMLLIMILLATAVFPVSVFAATGDINSIEFESSAKVQLTVGQTPKQLKVYANVEGSSSKRDVTGAVVWNSSNTNAVQVVNGRVTPIDSGKAIITATYNQALTTIEVEVTHPIKELKLEYSSEGNYKLGDEEDKLLVKANAIGGETATSAKNVTADTTWSSSNTSVLTIAEGKITLAGEGTSTITAKYKDLTATFKAVVKLPYSEIELKNDKGIVIKEIEMLVGDNPVKLAAFTKETTKTTANDISAKAEWSSSNTSIATVDKGEIKVLSAGKAVITVTYLGITQTVDVYVRAPFEALLLTPSGDQFLFMGESLNVKAEVRDAANSTPNVSDKAVWSSDNQLAVTVTASKESAAITAKAVGTSVVKAEHMGVSKSFKVTVYPTITELEADKTELDIYTEDSVSLPKVNGTKLDGTKLDLSQEIEWTSANDEIATIKDGKLVAETAGTVNIVGKIKSENPTSSKTAVRGKSVVVKVTVKDKVHILLGPEDNFVVVTGEEKAVPEVKAVMENGNELDATGTMEWEITGTNAIIKTTSSGKVIKGLVKGTATLKGTYANKSISIPVTIEQKVNKIVVEPNAVELNIKGSKSIKVTAYYSNGKTGNISSSMNWGSSNEAVATVKGTSVKAVTEGTATLSGSYQGIAASVKINVVPKLMKLTVNENRLKMAPGAVQNAIVVAQYDTGKTAVVTGSAAWTSSKPSVARVSASGQIVAVSKGTASIKGKIGTKTVTVTVTVK